MGCTKPERLQSFTCCCPRALPQGNHLLYRRDTEGQTPRRLALWPQGSATSIPPWVPPTFRLGCSTHTICIVPNCLESHCLQLHLLPRKEGAGPCPHLGQRASPPIPSCTAPQGQLPAASPSMGGPGSTSTGSFRFPWRMPRLWLCNAVFSPWEVTEMSGKPGPPALPVDQGTTSAGRHTAWAQ